MAYLYRAGAQLDLPVTHEHYRISLPRDKLRPIQGQTPTIAERLAPVDSQRPQSSPAPPRPTPLPGLPH